VRTGGPGEVVARRHLGEGVEALRLGLWMGEACAWPRGTTLPTSMTASSST